ncbi:MAG: hypothetical protein FWC00_02380 [Firmicutes bacterium]|nr:hypothetical protein [Bacillota bacterium]
MAYEFDKYGNIINVGDLNEPTEKRDTSTGVGVIVEDGVVRESESGKVVGEPKGDLLDVIAQMRQDLETEIE